ncbi:MAG: N-acetylmuramoyl-L-alanine amidase [Desulfuromonadales bacterium]|nr:N-acetylmuramoyl-L-alanine amidase [Desulfuromonadales bacterium]
MKRIIPLLFLLLCTVSSVYAAVEIRLAGGDPVQIRSVYWHDGTLFLSLREILPPLQLSGVWDGAKRLYRIKTAGGEMLLAPGSHKLRYGNRSLPLKQAPRFFAGELCVPEEVVTTHLPRLLDLEIIYSNPAAAANHRDDALPGGADDSLLPLPLQQIVIDPGHGGDDPGAISPAGLKEKDLTLALALRLEKLLKMEGLAQLRLTRDGDYAVSLRRRAGVVQGAAAENLLLSLHMSAWKSSQTHGCTIYFLPVRDNEEHSFLLAQSLDAALQEAGVADCTFERVTLSPLNQTPFPAVLIELGYLTNPAEFGLLSSSDGQERIARALALGVKNYAGNRPRRTTDVPVTQ